MFEKRTRIQDQDHDGGYGRHFLVDSRSGEISVLSSLDFEALARFENEDENERLVEFYVRRVNFVM